MEKQRDAWLDNVKALLMILVVVGHFTASLVKYSGAIEIMYKMINSFHMPCFMFITGFTSKRRIDNREYGKMVSSLFLPYLASQFLMWVVFGMIENGYSQISYQSSHQLIWLSPNYQLWYFLTIFLFSIVTPSLIGIFKKRPWMLLPIAFACSILIGFSQEIFYLRITKNIAYYPLFLAGYLFKKEWMAVIRNKKSVRVGAVAVFLVWAAVFILGNDYIYTKVFPLATPYAKYAPMYQQYGYPVLARCLYLTGSLVVAMAFMSLVPRGKTFFTYVGKNSRYVFVLHGFLVMYLRIYDKYTRPFFKTIGTRTEKLAFLAACVAVTFALASPPVVKVFKGILEPKIDWKRWKPVSK